MADPTTFELFNPTTWIPSVLAGMAGMYGVFRILKRDKRQDNQEQQVDAGTQQLIINLRTEVERLAGRVESMEKEIVSLHEERTIYKKERAMLMAKLAEYEASQQQPLI